ncbi:MAG: 3-dehydroquinate synthase [Deltaproteobacteria bacterium]|nr:3-dehydroquinate synthase [Deltaproteobacteria bacterium]
MSLALCGERSERAMQRLRLELKAEADRSYDVLVGRGILNDLHKYITRIGSFSSYALVTDDFVRPLVAEALQANLRSHDINSELLSFPPGEASKNMGIVLQLCQQLIARGFDRKSLLLAVGGGVVGDVTGFAAAIYMRGIPYVQVPTTLLAQVDSSIGGKTGVDLPSGKNLLGAFKQPLLVVSDPDVLNTLPVEARREGFAEIIKAALIANQELFFLLENERTHLLETTDDVLESIIAKTAEVKCQVVSQDEHESGLRRILNFGHTLGHALEAASNYSLTHGQAVAAGMGVAIQLSQKWAGLSSDDADRALRLIQSIGLPTGLPGNVNSASLLSALEKDKKIQKNICYFVLISKIGQAVIHPITVEDLKGSLDKFATN